MSLCAGYIAAQHKWDPNALGHLINSFFGTSSQELSENRIIETRYGHHIASFASNAVNRPLVIEDAAGNSLILLGFVREASDGSLLERVVRKGAVSLEALEGQFVALYWDVARSQIHIVNDRFGSRPFYLFRNGRDFYYASSLSFLFRLAKTKPSPDPIGWLQIFTYGQTLAQRTNRSGAVRLMPGSHMTISSSGIEDRQYWRILHEPCDLNAEAHADAVFEAFQDSAAWRAKRRPRCLIALSGGLDSRIVAASIPKGTDAVAFTLLTSPDNQLNLEVKTAAKVAEHLGLPHEIWPITPGNYSRIADEVVRLTDGLLPIHHPAKTMQFLERLNNDCGYLMGGNAGNILAGYFARDPAFLDPRRVDERGMVFLRTRATMPYHALRYIFSHDFLVKHELELNNSLLETWAGLKGSTAAHRASAWAMLNRQTGFNFTSPIHNHPYSEEAVPHLGYRYSDLMLQLPANWLYRQNFYSYMIHRKIPQLRDIVYANTGQLLSGRLESYAAPQWHPYREWLSHQAHQSVSRARQLISPLAYAVRGRARSSSKPDFDLSVLSRDTKLVADVEALLDHPNLPAFLDRNRCRAFLRDFGTSRYSSAHIFASLASAAFTAKQDAW